MHLGFTFDSSVQLRLGLLPCLNVTSSKPFCGAAIVF